MLVLAPGVVVHLWHHMLVSPCGHSHVEITSEGLLVAQQFPCGKS